MLLPEGRGISFDALEARDMAVATSQLNSEPRPSLMGLSPIALLRSADPEAADALASALGIEEIPYERLNLKADVVNQDRKERRSKS